MKDSDLPLPPLPHLGDKFALEEMQAYARAAVERERANTNVVVSESDAIWQREVRRLEAQAKAEPVALPDQVQAALDEWNVHPPASAEPVACIAAETPRTSAALAETLANCGFLDAKTHGTLCDLARQLERELNAHPPTQVEPVATIRQSPTGSFWIDWHGKQMPDYLNQDLYAHPPTSE